MIPFKHQRGLTLLELVVTLTLVSILAGLALPSFARLGRHLTVGTATDIVRAMANLARSEAVKRGTRVIVCPSLDGTVCTRQTTGTLLVYTDRNRDGDPDPGSQPIAREAVAEPVSLSYNRPYLAFSPRGHAYGTNGTFSICLPDDLASGAMLIISNTGRPRTALDYDGDGVVERAPGKPLQCP